MKGNSLRVLISVLLLAAVFSFTTDRNRSAYVAYYANGLDGFKTNLDALTYCIEKNDPATERGVEAIKWQINKTRISMKKMDFWFRYLDPLAYKKINGPLPVEWETEVFEKFEKPYKREGAGLTLAALYLEEERISKDTLLALIRQAEINTVPYAVDSIAADLNNYHHFFLCNRLFLLNLAAIYTTGFECPDTSRIIPELYEMLSGIQGIYTVFNQTYESTPLTEEYLALYGNTMAFVRSQTAQGYFNFNHFVFLRDYVNPLFALNQQFIQTYKVSSRSYVDFSLNKQAASIFSKNLYRGQNVAGVFHRVNDAAALEELNRLGKLLFYDPVLSGNNQRSCISCHNPSAYFTDTLLRASKHFNGRDLLTRNSVSLLNVSFNHLVMTDGKHISLQEQARAVITNPDEMNGKEEEVLKKVLSCSGYKKSFEYLLKYTPQEKEITLEHLVSAITFYYGKFSQFYAPFDEAMNKQQQVNASVQRGFNVFMGKAQCATCHFVPMFNGVKPPYVGSEFEVLGVPRDTLFSALSADSGRYYVNPAFETLRAFRTGSVRNAAHTAPYMHNGVFATLRQVIDFYDTGGGAGRNLSLENQTLSSDSLYLTEQEKYDLISFIRSLDEQITYDTAPASLPVSKIKTLNKRKVGGEY